MSISNTANAQRISVENKLQLKLMDDSLVKLGDIITNDELPMERERADSTFTRILVRSFKMPYSFYYHFNSLKTATVLYPDDSSFRIISWQYSPDDASYRQRGVIQMNTNDGSIKIFPLFDYSDFTDNPIDSIRTPRNWIGAVYYRIIQKKQNERTWYTLIGYDENDKNTTRKWMEMLYFNEKGEPRFGGSFILPADSAHPQPRTIQRYMMEYKKAAVAKLNYDSEENIIIMDHLISETNEPQKKYTLVPAGDYESFTWQNGVWKNNPIVFTQQLGDNNEPRPATILNEDGSFKQSKRTKNPLPETKYLAKPKQKSASSKLNQ